MDSLFAYVWKHSRGQQIRILAVVLLSFPFYFASLDLPKQIVSDAIQGKAFAGHATATLFKIVVPIPGHGPVTLFDGVSLERLPYLFALSAVFLALVVINGLFKYVINMRKGALGERVLQQLRFDLFSALLRFTPETLRNTKASEAATIIKDEVEPIGGFVGDAFIQPVFLSGQALTALGFILIQSPLLGVIAGGIVLAQGLVIPKLRREQLRLSKERQIHSRALAGRIGEIVEGAAEVGNHGTQAYERTRIGDRLERLYDIRYRLYGRKFMVKFINNFMAQLTPFLFYVVGGYLALTGRLDIGQLVAVIAAYRDLPPPIKELIDWDQQRLDVAVKYQQVVEQFTGARMEEGRAMDEAAFDPTQGSLDIAGLTVVSPSGDKLLDHVSATLPLGGVVAVAGDSDGVAALAMVLGRRITAYDGQVILAGQRLDAIPPSVAGRAMAYVGSDPTLFEGSLRDNILYGLNRAMPSGQAADWIDYRSVGVTGPADIDPAIMGVLRVVGLDEAVYRFGLAQRIDPSAEPETAARVVAARALLRSALDAAEAGDLVETFDPAHYHHHSTVGENILFGVPADGAGLESQLGPALVGAALSETGLTQPLAEMGRRIAATMVEIFADLPADHPLFGQFSFLPAAELPRFQEILRRWDGGMRGEPDRDALIGLALRYIEPRHRLGLLTEPLRAAIVAARQRVRDGAGALSGLVEYYDPARYCAAAPLRDNLLFGRVVFGLAGALDRVTAIIQDIAMRQGLDGIVHRLGLDQPVGVAGRRLSPTQRAGVALARSLIKRPRILVLHNALAGLGEAERDVVAERIRVHCQGATLIVAEPGGFPQDRCDARLIVDHGKLRLGHAGEGAPVEAPVPADDAVAVRALRAVPLFASLDTPRLKLLAFTGEMLTFRAGQVMVRQDDVADCAYVVLEGDAEAFRDVNGRSVPLSRVGRHAVVGEMGIVTGAPRSATVVAAKPLRALRISRDVFLSLVSEVPQFSLALLREQVQRTIRTEERLFAASQARDQADRPA